MNLIFKITKTYGHIKRGYTVHTTQKGGWFKRNNAFETWNKIAWK
jgi:hypothetical protein